MPAIGVVAAEAGCRVGVGERQERGNRPRQVRRGTRWCPSATSTGASTDRIMIERCASRVHSERAPLGKVSVAGADAVQQVRSLQEVDEHPAECGKEIRHRGNVDEGHVVGDADLRVLPDSSDQWPMISSKSSGRGRRIGVTAAQDPGEHGLDLYKGGVLGSLPLARHSCHCRLGARTPAAPSSSSRATTRRSSSARIRERRPGPAGESEAVAEAARQREDVTMAIGAELGVLRVDRPVERWKQTTARGRGRRGRAGSCAAVEELFGQLP